MFDNLSDRLGNVFDRLKGRGALSESDVREAMREIRVALLEADVALPVVRRFIDAVTEKSVARHVGETAQRSVNCTLIEASASNNGHRRICRSICVVIQSV